MEHIILSGERQKGKIQTVISPEQRIKSGDVKC